MRQSYSTADQIMANANYKQAAHYDLDGSKIVLPGGYVGTLREATLYVLERMERFYRRLHSEETPFDEAFAVLDYQRKKLLTRLTTGMRRSSAASSAEVLSPKD